VQKLIFFHSIGNLITQQKVASLLVEHAMIVIHSARGWRHVCQMEKSIHLQFPPFSLLQAAYMLDVYAEQRISEDVGRTSSCFKGSPPPAPTPTPEPTPTSNPTPHPLTRHSQSSHKLTHLLWCWSELEWSRAGCSG